MPQTYADAVERQGDASFLIASPIRAPYGDEHHTSHGEEEENQENEDHADDEEFGNTEVHAVIVCTAH
ncbi:hypothetical protein SAMN05444920_120182 [Nonomuraea solani]|uniref:Uncharacterized protein n=1 Tax=Nonomuraea solani TaxID=1144553 RepID=A0A1H6EUG9_9ACTN|nr:hypothetical protein [Nonomuraea solani]SEH01478.1 hypothetical protein SAMN05444920_120182 [Nonomuraea solani]